MALIGYVSDERFVALADVLVEVAAPGSVQTVRSTASGAIHADPPSGPYRVTLAKAGYGSKWVDMQPGDPVPHHFRLLPDCLLGYARPKWVRAGERGEICLHSPEAVRLSLRRYGREVGPEMVLGWLDEHGPRAMIQITPDGDYTQGGVAWNRQGYANPAYRPMVTAPERSGLYYFHAQGESGAFFSFPWVVAPARPQARIAVMAATNTWAAYNNFGGRSNYINAARLPERPTVVSRLEMPRYQQGAFSEHHAPDQDYAPLAFERPEPLNQVRQDEQPTDPIRGRQTCHLAPAEWRLLSWLEREGYEYDLYADAQLHDGTLDLDHYQVLILSTHPEYWSRPMYQAVQRWVFERGGRLLYLGGNGLDCEVEFLDGPALRFLTQNPAPGSGLDDRMHRTFTSPAGLVGVVFTDAGAMTGAPYEVLDASHWLFAGTGLHEGDRFGARSLSERCPGGASGHETDKTTPHTPPQAQILARGLNPDHGGAELICFETAGGGLVVSVGSITWGAALLVDEQVSRITRNALDRALAR